MGHATTTRYVTVEQASTVGAALDAAVQDWYQEEAGRHDNASPGPSYDFPLMTEDAASKSVHRDDGTGRWGVSGDRSVVVPTCAEKDAVVKTVNMALTVTSEDLAFIRAAEHWNLLDRFTEQLGGGNVIKVELVSVPKPRKAVATATEGKAVTRYKLVGQDWKIPKTLHDSQAEARKAGLALMDERPELTGVDVVAVVTRDTGKAALVSIRRPEPETAKAMFKVTTSTPKAGAKQAGWLVAFDYHH